MKLSTHLLQDPLLTMRPYTQLNIQNVHYHSVDGGSPHQNRKRPRPRAQIAIEDAEAKRL